MSGNAYQLHINSSPTVHPTTQPCAHVDTDESLFLPGIYIKFVSCLFILLLNILPPPPSPVRVIVSVASNAQDIYPPPPTLAFFSSCTT